MDCILINLYFSFWNSYFKEQLEFLTNMLFFKKQQYLVKPKQQILSVLFYIFTLPCSKNDLTGLVSAMSTVLCLQGI